MPKYRVVFWSPYCLWEDVEAANEADAIGKCETPPEYDLNEPSYWTAEEQQEEE